MSTAGDSGDCGDAKQQNISQGSGATLLTTEAGWQEVFGERLRFPIRMPETIMEKEDRLDHDH